jgi:tRNA dimethylallyltransferase
VGGTVLYFKSFYQGLFEGPTADPQVRAEIRRRADAVGLAALHAELLQVDPEAAARIHPNDLRRIERALEVYQLTGTPISRLQSQWVSQAIRRPDWNWTLIGLRHSRESANQRINQRVRRMVSAGLVDEARRIWTDPRGVGEQARQAVGYAELFAHFTGQYSLEDAVERIKINSRQLAKHQRTWLRRLEDVHWIDVPEEADLPTTLEQAAALVS